MSIKDRIEQVMRKTKLEKEEREWEKKTRAEEIRGRVKNIRELSLPPITDPVLL